jgi:hypothetical protein
MKNYLNCAYALVCAFVFDAIAVSIALGADDETSLVFKIPDVTVTADGVHPTQGTLHVSLELNGDFATNPPMIASYNVALALAGQPAEVAFAAPQDTGANKLFAAGSSFAGATVLPHTIRFAKDALSPVPAIDGGVMVSVPFTIDAGVIAGTFPIQFIPGNELTNPMAVALPIVLTSGSITVRAAASSLAGDYNEDGTVDAADYVVWRNSLGQSGAGLQADGNGSGSIDADDYTVWRARLGQASSTGAALAIVPEPPAALLLAAIGAVVWTSKRLRQPGRNRC